MKKFCLIVTLISLAFVGVYISTAQDVTGCWKDDGTWTDDLKECRDILLTQVPLPSSSPFFTVTPEDTPVASLVPSTNTPTPIATEWIPTPESSITPYPTDTPGPTEEPPVNYGCAGTVTVNGNLNLRKTPNGTIIGTLADGTRVWVLNIQYDANDNEWAEIRASADIHGWVAHYYAGVEYIDLDDTPECQEMRWPDPFDWGGVRKGFHIIQGPRAGDPSAMPFAWGLLKCTTGSEDVCLRAKAANPDLVIIFRQIIQDCPTEWQWEHPSAFYSVTRSYMPDRFDYYEIVNECFYDNWEVIDDFWVEITRMAHADGKKILAYSYYPSNPPLDAWQYLCDSLEVVDGIALHESAYWPEDIPIPDNGLWLSNPWIAGYHNYMHEAILEGCNIDIKRYHGPIVITELGTTNGYDDLTCEELQIAWDEEGNHLSDIIDGWAMWNVGNLGWQDISDCLQELAYR